MNQATATRIPTVPLYIDGKAVESASTDWHEVLNPATQEVVARVPFATVDEVDRAVASASKAFESWRNTSLAQRMRIMLSLQQLVRAHMAELAELMTEVGWRDVQWKNLTGGIVAMHRGWVK